MLSAARSDYRCILGYIPTLSVFNRPLNPLIAKMRLRTRVTHSAVAVSADMCGGKPTGMLLSASL